MGSAALLSAALLSAFVLLGGNPPASVTTSNLHVLIPVGTPTRGIFDLRNGQGRIVYRLAFKAGILVESSGPDGAIVRARFELPPGLHWGAHYPDPAEDCTSTATVADCHSTQQVFTDVPSVRWLWDVVADAPGTYTLKGSLVDSSTPDPDLSDNAASVTVIVDPSAIVASPVELSPARPRAGSSFIARVEVTVDGVSGSYPDRLRCAGTVSGRRLDGSPNGFPGEATCRYRTPKSARGKTLRGTIAFTTLPEEVRFTRRFAVKLH
jgi:hypothetical protein